MEQQILGAFFNGADRVLVDSPPGAGKTYLVESTVELAARKYEWRVAVGTHASGQRDAFALRFHRRFPSIPLQVMVSSTDPFFPDDLLAAGISVVTKPGQIRDSTKLIIANVAKHFFNVGCVPVDMAIVDEAYQIHYKSGLPVNALAPSRFLMVGDPGQIAPFSDVEDVEVFEAARDHVLWSLPKEMLQQHAVQRLQIDVSRRLPPDTVEIIQPAFYPNLPFRATDSPLDRGVAFATSGIAANPIDRALDAIAAGASLVVMQLPDLGYEIEFDQELCDLAVTIAERCRQRGLNWPHVGHSVRFDGHGPNGVEELIYCDSHIDSGTDARLKFNSANLAVLADTPNVIQGQEALLSIIKHPLSGLHDADAFHLDPGRLCVMLSRHKLACIMLVRGDIGPMLDAYEHDCGATLVGREDVVWRGYSSHREIWDAMVRLDRVFTVSP